MSSPSSVKEKVRQDWIDTNYGVQYLAYKHGLTEQSVRRMVSGLEAGKREKRSLSAYHRALGMRLVDKRLESGLGKQDFAHSLGMSHFRLDDLEKGYNDITISEILRAGLQDGLDVLDATLLANE